MSDLIGNSDLLGNPDLLSTKTDLFGFSDKIISILNKINTTPKVYTTISFICVVLSVIILLTRKNLLYNILSAFFFIASYLFSCYAVYYSIKTGHIDKDVILYNDSINFLRFFLLSLVLCKRLSPKLFTVYLFIISVLLLASKCGEHKGGMLIENYRSICYPFFQKDMFNTLSCRNMFIIMTVFILLANN